MINYDESRRRAVGAMLAARAWRDANPDPIGERAAAAAAERVKGWRDGPVKTAYFNREYERVLAMYGRIPGDRQGPRVEAPDVLAAMD